MGQQINQYTKQRIESTIENDDLLDVDSTDDAGSSYESAKMKVLEFVNYIKSQIQTFYTSDGTLTGNRNVTANGNFTKFNGGDVIVKVADEVTDNAFLVNDISDVEKARMGFDQATDSAELNLKNNTGTYFEANDGDVSINTDVAHINSDTVILGSQAGDANFRLNIDTNGSINPISLHENRPGGGLNGDNNSIDFYYNDSTGSKTLGGQIQTIIGIPTSGDVKMSMILKNDLKIQDTGRVLVTPNALTAAAVAQFEVRSTTASGGNTTCLFKAGGNTASQLVLWLQNLSGNNLMYVDATGKHFHNVSKLATGDFQMSGDNETYVFYMNAGTENVGIGTNNPSSSAALEVNSTSKGFRIAPMTAAQASAITPSEGLMVFTSDTDATFTSVGFWGYESGSWNKL